MVTLLLEPSLVEPHSVDDLNRKKKGRPFVFSAALIRAVLAVKCALHLGYRQLEGLVNDVCKKLDVKVPNFRTIWWRFDKSKIEPIKRLTPHKSRAIMAIDATGLRPVNDGEYRAMKYDKRREWIKMHALFDVENKEFVNISITGGRINDCLEFEKVIKPVAHDVSEILADKGYDTSNIFEICRKGNIVAKIPVKLNSTNSSSTSRSRRDAVVDQLGFQIRPGSNKLNIGLTEEKRLENQNEWKSRVGYGRRSLIESSFSAYKRIFGEYVFSRKKRNIRKEIVVKLNLFNLFSVMR